MYYAFIDESGYPSPVEGDERPVLVAVCIRDSEIRRVTQLLYKAEIDCFGEDPSGRRQLKGKKYIHKRSLEERYNNRKEYVEKVLEIFESYNTSVFAVIMERPDFMPFEEEDMLPPQHRFLLQRLNHFGRSKDTDVLVIFDKVDDSKDGSIANGFKGFLYRSTEGKSFEYIIEMPLFVASINTPLIRFPDLAGNILREIYNINLFSKKPSDPFEEWLLFLGSKLISKTTNFKSKFQGRYITFYGIHQMSKDKFIKRP